MAKKPKNKYIGARVDEDMDSRVAVYISAADTNMGDLVRNGVEEYMRNHPVKQERENPSPDAPSVQALAGANAHRMEQ